MNASTSDGQEKSNMEKSTGQNLEKSVSLPQNEVYGPWMLVKGRGRRNTSQANTQRHNINNTTSANQFAPLEGNSCQSAGCLDKRKSRTLKPGAP